MPHLVLKTTEISVEASVVVKLSNRLDTVLRALEAVQVARLLLAELGRKPLQACGQGDLCILRKQDEDRGKVKHQTYAAGLVFIILRLAVRLDLADELLRSDKELQTRCPISNNKAQGTRLTEVRSSAVSSIFCCLTSFSSSKPTIAASLMCFFSSFTVVLMRSGPLISTTPATQGEKK